jgi:hypothetical protein
MTGRAPKVFTFTDQARRGLTLDQAEHVRQCRYAVVAQSAAAAVRALDQAGIKVTAGFLRTYGVAAPAYGSTAGLPEAAGGPVFYREANQYDAEWRPVPPLPAAPLAFTYRKTAPGIYALDAGPIHLGTVQRLGDDEWWAYPPGSASSFTGRSREEAAAVLLAKAGTGR